MTSGMVGIDHHKMLINEKDKRITELQVEIIKYQRMHEDSVHDSDVMLNMLHHFVTIFVERRDEDIIKDALEYVYDSTGIDYEAIAEIVERLAICDPDLCKREYNVRVTVPVEVTVNVTASSASEAEEAARNDIDLNGLESYSMEYNLWYDAECYTEES